MSITLPTDDPAWHKLTLDERSNLYAWMTALDDVAGMPASIKSGERINLLMRRMGVSRAVARERFYDWRRSPQWRSIANGNVFRRVEGDRGVHSARFKAWGRAVLDKHQRSEQQGILEIQDRLRMAREIIPGFEDWAGGGLPPGCSAPNLRRVLARTKAERATAQWGPKTAAAYLPYVRTTRVGLEPGMQYMWDDVWHDHYILDHRHRAVRVLELGAHDVASGCRINYGFLPRSKKEDGQETGHIGLTGAMMRSFVAGTLRRIGYHPSECLLMMEHGTATLKERYVRLLHDATGGVVRVGMGGMQGSSNALMGGWAGRNSGNPCYKSMIECLHSLIHNVLDAVPGQSGRNRTQPETTDGILAYHAAQARKLDKLGRLRSRLQAVLREPLMSLSEFAVVLRDVYDIINNRTSHQLEGWRECGYMVREYMLAEGVWTPAGGLPDPARGSTELAAWQSIQALVAADPRRVREVRMSPAAVWQRGLPRLTRLGLDGYAMMVDDSHNRRELTVRRGYLTLQDKRLAPEPHYYHALVRHDDAIDRPLKEGEKYEAIINPYDLTHLIMLDARGRILGEAPQSVAAPRNDEAAVKREMGVIAHRRSLLLEDYRVRHEPDRAAAAALREHNAAAIAEADGTAEKKSSLTPAQKGMATRLANSVGDEIDVLDLPEAPAPQPVPELPGDPDINIDNIIF